MSETTVIGYCKECGIAVTEENVYSTEPKVICQKCHDAEVYEAEMKVENAERTKEYNRSRMKRKRNLSLIFGGIAGLVVLILFIIDGVKDPMIGSIGGNIGVGIAASYVVFAFVASLFFDGIVRNAVLWMCERSIRFPGLIFELDLDGIIWFITVKLIFGILGFLAGVLFAILGVIFGLVIAPFVYPFSFFYQIRCINKVDVAEFE